MKSPDVIQNARQTSCSTLSLTQSISSCSQHARTSDRHTHTSSAISTSPTAGAADGVSWGFHADWASHEATGEGGGSQRGTNTALCMNLERFHSLKVLDTSGSAPVLVGLGELSLACPNIQKASCGPGIPSKVRRLQTALHWRIERTTIGTQTRQTERQDRGRILQASWLCGTEHAADSDKTL